MPLGRIMLVGGNIQVLGGFTHANLRDVTLASWIDLVLLRAGWKEPQTRSDFSKAGLRWGDDDQRPPTWLQARLFSRCGARTWLVGLLTRY